MTEDNKYFYAGADADDLDAAGKAPVQTTEAEPFDPFAALEKQGLSAAAMPKEIDSMDLSAFRTADSEPVEEDELVLDQPAPVGINPKDALGMKKPDLSLVPPASMLYQSQGMMDGAVKYGPYNWRGNSVQSMVYVSAAMRHLQQYLDGEDFDPTSGVPHIGHALACLGIIADATETGNLVDTRPKPGAAGDMIRRFNDNQSFKRD